MRTSVTLQINIKMRRETHGTWFISHANAAASLNFKLM